MSDLSPAIEDALRVTFTALEEIGLQVSAALSAVIVESVAFGESSANIFVSFEG